MSSLADKSTDQPRLIDELPGWLCVLGGLVLLGMVIITPTYLATQTTRWRLDLMREQARRLDEQKVRYEQFDDALEARDRAVIERLAFAELRLKPVDRELIGPSGGPGRLLLGREMRSSPPGTESANRQTAARRPGAIPDWLRINQPVVGLDYPTKPAPRSLLTRISTGPLRWLGLTLGLTCLIIGILFSPRTRRPTTG